MKNKIAKKIFIALAVVGLLFAGCSGGSSSSSDSVEAQGISITPKAVSIKSGESVSLEATLTPANAESTIAWSVDANATLSPAAGKTTTVSGTYTKSGNNDYATANVTAATSNGKTATCAVKIWDADVFDSLPTGISLNTTEWTVDLKDEENLSSAKITGTEITATVTASGSDYKTVTWTSSSETIATVTADSNDSAKATVKITGKAGEATITAKTVNDLVATVKVTASGNVISASDTPIGFASIDAESSFGGYGGTVTTVTTKAELKSQLEDSTKRVIYVSGTIDLSEGLMPTEAGGSTAKLDDFVSKVTTGLHNSNSTKYPNTYTTYNAFKTAYAALCSDTTDDKSSSSTATTLSQTLWALNKGYQGSTSSFAKMYSNDWKGVVIQVKSNKTLIGINGAKIKGGAISINGQSNIAIRNITFQDAYDPFPHHEKNDGFNAELDCVVIQGTCSNIWVDHCTFEDTMHTSTVTVISGSGKWQTYDGLLDMKNDIRNITVSNTIIQNHDKCMLIGNDDDDGNNATRTISHIQNYYLNCGQRLPMVRNTRLHALNNVYDTNVSKHYTQQYAIGNRANALLNVEGCYFGSGIKYSIKDSYGKFWMSGCSDNSENKTSGSSESAKVFTVPYAYTPMSAAAAKTYVLANAGADKWTVKK